MQLSYYNIPDEMKIYRQFVCWRYEDRESGKPTKVPYNPNNGHLASVSDPTSWVSFDEAVAAAAHPQTPYDGIGFVLSKADPYTFIDLDYTEDEASRVRQKRVYEEFESYSEFSPSKRGVHVIVKGHVPSGRKRSAIEVYSESRYMTMTGDVYRPGPIESRQELLTNLWEQMGRGANGTTNAVHNQPQREEDSSIIKKALDAKNGIKFQELHAGRWQGMYKSQSEADFAYIDIIVFYTQNIEQIIRLWFACPLSDRPKGKRIDYVMHMIHRAFDRQLPPIDFIDKQDKVETAIISGALPLVASMEAQDHEAALAHLKDLWFPQEITAPPGLMGQIMQFIYSASPRQVRETALVAAIGLMAGICGRSYNISGTGLNLYILLLAQTGIGKEVISSGISKLVHALTHPTEDGPLVPAIANFIGPTDFASGQALNRYIAEMPNKQSFVAILGEFGLRMQQMASHMASANDLALRRSMLNLFGKSGQSDVLGETAFANKDNNTAVVRAPAVTFLAESTPETFFEVVDERLVKDGLLPRFLIIEYTGDRTPLNKAHRLAAPAPELLNKLGDLCVQSLQLQNKGIAQDIQVTPDAEQFLDEIESRTTLLINRTKRDAMRELWNRAHLKTLKLAGLVAIGIDPHWPTVDLNCAQWAYNVVVTDILNMTRRFNRGEVGVDNNDLQQTRTILRMAVEYLQAPYQKVERYYVKEQLFKNRIIPLSYFSRRSVTHRHFKHDRRGPTKALELAIKGLCESGDLIEVGKGILVNNYDYAGRAFMLADPAQLPAEIFDT